jgi:hypothetical protein
MKALKFAIALCAICIIGSCHKDVPYANGSPAPDIDTLPTCTIFPPAVCDTCIGFGYDGSFDDVLYESPKFLPNSNNEFVVRRDSTNINDPARYFDIIHYNMSTKNKRIVARVGGLNTVSVNDKWVVFNGFYPCPVFRVNLLGSSPQLFTALEDADAITIDHCFFPNSSKFVANLNINDSCYIVDVESGRILERFVGMERTLCINTDNICAGYKFRKDTTTGNEYRVIVTYDYNTKKYTNVAEVFSDPKKVKPPIYSMAWSADNQYLFYTDLGNLYRLNVQTKQIVAIRSGCDDYKFDSVAISADGKKLLCKVIIRIYTALGHKVHTKQQIFLMDTDGGALQRVL